MRYQWIAAALGLLAMTAGCATEEQAYHPPAGEKVRISQQTYREFQQYQATIGSTRPGAFAVSKTGRSSWYYYCEEVICKSGISWGQGAVQSCERFGEPCYVFAYGNEVKVDYEVVP
jgi:hypothetical protein